MIVCICNNVSDRDIRAAARRGMITMTELRSELSVGTCCGKCQGCAKQVLREAVAMLEQEETASPAISLAAA